MNTVEVLDLLARSDRDAIEAWLHKGGAPNFDGFPKPDVNVLREALPDDLNMGFTYAPDLVAVNLLIVVAVKQAEVEPCVHVKTLQQPAAAILLARHEALCRECLVKVHAAGMAVPDDGHCDFCREPVEYFTPFGLPMKHGLMWGDYCTTCAEGWKKAFGPMQNPETN